MAVQKKKTAGKKAPVRKTSTPKKKMQKKWPAPVKVALAGLLLILLSPFYYGYVLRTFSATWRWVRDIGRNPHYRMYRNFNIALPDKYHVRGIDVSYAQGKIDWQKVRAMNEDSVHITFAFIKATEGILSADPYFQRNWREAAKNGIICGAYHYFKPAKSGVWQARFFLQTVKEEKGDLPLVVDVEELNHVSADKMREQLKSFLGYIEKRSKTRPIIYAEVSFYQKFLKGYFDGYPLWIANYNQPDLTMTKGSHWAFWQHSDRATVNGINHVVDFDAFNGDSTALQQLLIK